MKFSQSIFLILLASGPIHAATSLPTPGTKLLICIDRGSFLGGCKLTNTQLAPAQPFEVDLNVTYKFPCKGPGVEFNVRTPSKPVQPDEQTPFAFYPFTFTSESKTTNATGYGPFDVFDKGPIKTENRPFDKSCDLTIESISIKASTATKEKWTGDLASLNTLLTSYKDNVNSWSALALLEPAFAVYDTLVANASADFSNQTELLNASKELLSCTDGTTDEGCETVIGRIIDSKQLVGFSDDEGKKLSKLQTALFNADFSGVLECDENASGPCVSIDQFLKKYLTADDIAKLNAAREKLKLAVGAKDKLSHYEGQVKATEDEIVRLTAIMKEYE